MPYRVFFDEDSPCPKDKMVESDYVDALSKSLLSIPGTTQSSKNDFIDIYIFSSKGVQYPPRSKRIEDNQKRILLFFSDETESVPVEWAKSYLAIFKSYLPTEEKIPHNIFPLPLGIVNGTEIGCGEAVKERKYDCVFIGNLNKDRIPLYFQLSAIPKILLRNAHGRLSRSGFKRVALMLQKLRRPEFRNSMIKFTGGFLKGLSSEEYYELLKQSKIAFCPRGFSSPETFRHYEAASAGCVVISECLPKTELYSSCGFVQIKSWQEGINKAREILSSSKKLESHSKQSSDWWNDRAKPEAAARLIHETTKKLSLATSL